MSSALPFTLASLVVIATPGIGATYAVATALSRGLRAGLVASLALAVATLPHALLAITGLAALLHATPTLFRILTYLGAAFLVYLAWGMWRDTGGLDGEPRASSAAGVLREVLAMNLLNPKLTLFFVAFLPQFVPAGAPRTTMTLTMLSLAFMALTALVYAGYVLLAARLRDQIARRPDLLVVIRRVFAVTFVALGALTVLTGQTPG
ncbi:MAG: LysE family translocator [Actinomycetales bacterium]